MTGTTKDKIAWGVDIRGDAVHLIQLHRENGKYHCTKYGQASLDERWDMVADVPGAISRLVGKSEFQSVAGCISDQLVMYRMLQLPHARQDALDQMVRSQFEVLIPDRGQAFVYDWDSWTDPQNPSKQCVLLCAARKDAVANAMNAVGRVGWSVNAIAPSLISISRLWMHCGVADKRHVLLLDIQARCTGLAIVCGKRLVSCGLVDLGSDHWVEHLADGQGISYREAQDRLWLNEADDSSGVTNVMDEWTQQLREVYEHCVSGIERDARPKECHVFGQASRNSRVIANVSAALSLDTHKTQTPEDIVLEDGVDFAVASGAIAAAMSGLETFEPLISLVPARKETKAARSWGKWCWAAAAICLIIGMFWVSRSDKAEAERISETLGELRRSTDCGGGIERHLALGKYMEARGPTPMEVLDSLSNCVPSSTVVTKWRYDRDGSVILSGIAPNEQEFIKTLGQLSKVGEVEFKSGRPHQRRFHFEVHLNMSAPMKGMAKDKTKSSSAGGNAKGGSV